MGDETRFETFLHLTLDGSEMYFQTPVSSSKEEPRYPTNRRLEWAPGPVWNFWTAEHILSDSVNRKKNCFYPIHRISHYSDGAAAVIAANMATMK